MRIAVVGRGQVGSALGAAWTAAGHEVRFARRTPSATDEVTYGAAGEWADTAVLACPAGAVGSVMESLTLAEGRLVIDATNPLLPGLTGLDHPDGAAPIEELQRAHPQVTMVKAFNSVGVDVMRAPSFGGSPALMPYCGPAHDTEAARVVDGLIRDVGFEPLWSGPLERARQLEHLALLWIRLAIDTPLGRGFAFGLLRHTTATDPSS